MFIIDEFNEKFENKSVEELRYFADLNFCEADLVVRLGYPFRQMASFNMQGTSRDIVIPKKGFVIEVMYLRNFTSNPQINSRAAKLVWKEAFQKDYEWLTNEIISGQKGKRAFVIGWFNAVERFSQLMQLGEGSGKYPKINQEKLRLFPFLTHKSDSDRTRDIFYKYVQAFIEKSIFIRGYQEE